ncbi:MAG TPA: hypothetical protein VFN21_04145 [Acidimicrobiales bacterium]|nr:hypothetical protein [Acidimicrobiales bacterium]
MSRLKQSAMIPLLVASLLFVGACSSGDDSASSDDTTSTIAFTKAPDDGAEGTSDSDDSDADADATTTSAAADEPVELSGSYCDMAKQAEDDTYSLDMDATDPDKALTDMKKGFGESLDNGKALRSAAPAAIADDIDAVLDALETANPKIQGATSMDEAMTAFSGVMDPEFIEHANKISAYDEAECGIDAGTLMTPSDD